MRKTMYCPACEEDCEFVFEERDETYDVRGDSITLRLPLWVCPACGETVVDDDFGDPVEKAYEGYRDKHGLLQSAEIQRIREQWGLSQVAFAALLGMSQATINRYERGALQQQKEDELIRACANREHMQDVLQRNGHLLTDRQRRAAALAIGTEPSKRRFLSWLDQLFEPMPSEVSLRSGFRTFDFDRYATVVVWLCSHVSCVTQTKLYKLLFYTDFLCFKSTSKSLTGSLYRQVQYGPVPVGFSDLRARLEAEDFVFVNEVTYQNGNTGEEFRPGPRANEARHPFTEEEIRVLCFVKDQLGGLTPSVISDLSHKESAWRDTATKEIISYEKAIELSLSLPE